MKENNLNSTIPNNSEQLEELKEGFIKLGKQLVENFKPVIEAAAKVMKATYKTIMKAYSVDPEIKKCYGIYKRTKKRKDQKKANEQNDKNNRKEIY